MNADAETRLRRALDDLDLETGALTMSRADVVRVAGIAFEFGADVASADDAGERHCRICGCTYLRACPGGCSWTGPDLCSACQPFTEQP